MNKGFSLLTGIGLGAGMMYLCDPTRGQRRRVSIHDEVCRVWDKSDDAIEKAARDLRSRARGIATEALAILNGAERKLETSKALADQPKVQSRQPNTANPELQQAKGSPTGRLLVRLGGGVLLLYGRQRGGLIGKSLGAMGMGLVLQGINFVEWKRLLVIGNRSHTDIVEENSAS